MDRAVERVRACRCKLALKRPAGRVSNVTRASIADCQRRTWIVENHVVGDSIVEPRHRRVGAERQAHWLRSRSGREENAGAHAEGASGTSPSSSSSPTTTATSSAASTGRSRPTARNHGQHQVEPTNQTRDLPHPTSSSSQASLHGPRPLSWPGRTRARVISNRYTRGAKMSRQPYGGRVRAAAILGRMPDTRLILSLRRCRAANPTPPRRLPRCIQASEKRACG